MKGRRSLLLTLVVTVMTLAARPAFAAPDAPAGNQFVNGNFELGSGTGWIEYSSQGFYPVILPDYGPIALPADIVPHSGYYAAWLGSYNLEVTTIRQQVTISADAPLLGTWNWVRSAESNCDRDSGRVLINSAQVMAFGLCVATRSSAWDKRTVDLSLFTGQTVWLQLQADTDAASPSDLFVDDVFLEPNPLPALAVAATRAGVNQELLRLTWPHAALYSGYEVWRSIAPYFLPGAAGAELRPAVKLPHSGDPVIYDDSGAVGNVAANYFYVVRGAGAGVTRAGNRIGEFDFPLMRGG